MVAGERKDFFSEEKKQKTSFSLASPIGSESYLKE